MKIHRLLPLLMLCTVLGLKAQTITKKNNFELEVDPLAYILNGYSFHFIYTHAQIRYDLGIFGLEQPQFLSGNKNYKAVSNGVGFKVNYLFKPMNSFYAGLDIGTGRTQITSDRNGDSDTNHDVTIGTHLGYRYFPFGNSKTHFKQVYLTPWMGISYAYFYDKTKFTDYNEEPIAYFATVHVGYRF